MWTVIKYPDLKRIRAPNPHQMLRAHARRYLWMTHRSRNCPLAGIGSTHFPVGRERHRWVLRVQCSVTSAPALTSKQMKKIQCDTLQRLRKLMHLVGPARHWVSRISRCGSGLQNGLLLKAADEWAKTRRPDWTCTARRLASWSAGRRSRR